MKGSYPHKYTYKSHKTYCWYLLVENPAAIDIIHLPLIVILIILNWFYGFLFLLFVFTCKGRLPDEPPSLALHTSLLHRPGLLDPQHPWKQQGPTKRSTSLTPFVLAKMHATGKEMVESCRICFTTSNRLRVILRLHLRVLDKAAALHAKQWIYMDILGVSTKFQHTSNMPQILSHLFMKKI